MHYIIKKTPRSQEKLNLKQQSEHLFSVFPNDSISKHTDKSFALQKNKEITKEEANKLFDNFDVLSLQF